MTTFGVVFLTFVGMGLAVLWVTFLIGLVVTTLDARAARALDNLPAPVRPGSFSQDGG